MFYFVVLCIFACRFVDFVSRFLYLLGCLHCVLWSLFFDFSMLFFVYSAMILFMIRSLLKSIRISPTPLFLTPGLSLLSIHRYHCVSFLDFILFLLYMLNLYCLLCDHVAVLISSFRTLLSFNIAMSFVLFIQCLIVHHPLISFLTQHSY